MPQCCGFFDDKLTSERSVLQILKKIRWTGFAAFFVVPLVMSGCASNPIGMKSASIKETKKIDYPQSERTCLERAMFFESLRSSRAGMIAVGTVVMNRVNSSAYPNTICGVVGQPHQFAPGVLTRPMNSKAMPDVQEAADAVLRGERDPKLKNAMFFHTAGLKFPYKNMHYVRVAGGNAFYEKRSRNGGLQVPVNDQPYNVALAYAQDTERDGPVFDMLKRSSDRNRIHFPSAAIAKANYHPISVNATTPDNGADTLAVNAAHLHAAAENPGTSDGGAEVKLASLPVSNVPVPTFADSLTREQAGLTPAQPSQDKLEKVAAMLVAQQQSASR